MDEAVHIMVGFILPALFFFVAGAWQAALLWWGFIILWEAWKVTG